MICCNQSGFSEVTGSNPVLTTNKKVYFNMDNWRTLTSDELWDFFNKDLPEYAKRVVIKPKYPTRRWGQTYTKESTTDIKEVNKVIPLLKDCGFTVRKRIEKKTNLGVFYKIEIKNHPDRIK